MKKNDNSQSEFSNFNLENISFIFHSRHICYYCGSWSWLCQYPGAPDSDLWTQHPKTVRYTRLLSLLARTPRFHTMWFSRQVKVDMSRRVALWWEGTVRDWGTATRGTHLLEAWPRFPSCDTELGCGSCPSNAPLFRPEPVQHYLASSLNRVPFNLCLRITSLWCQKMWQS